MLSSAGLSRIRAHAYVAGATTSLDAALRPWWRAVAAALPVWLAPNAVTLLGTAALVLSATLLTALSAGGASPPAWSQLLAAASVLFYQTMDAADGSHARFLGLASPLGQLFDHGCDALAAVAAAVARPEPSEA